jgi:sestrin
MSDICIVLHVRVVRRLASTTSFTPARKRPSLVRLSAKDELSMYFFQPLFTDDEAARADAAKRLCERLQAAAASSSEDERRLVRHHFLTCVRLSLQAPFEDVRTTFARLVEQLNARRGELQLPEARPGPASWYFPAGVVEVAEAQGRVQRLLQDIFLRTGRVTHLERVLAWHPSFLETWYLTQMCLMRGPGPLPGPWRNYIALLAAARHKCAYLVRLQEEEFRLNSGDARWLEGLHALPRKLQAWLPVNALLAHQPWLLTREHVAALSRGADAWSVSELVHAVAIQTAFTSLASICFALGLAPELDVPGSGPDEPPEDADAARAPTASEADRETELLNEQKKILAELLKKRQKEDAEQQQQQQQQQQPAQEEDRVASFARAADAEEASASVSLSASPGPSAAGLERYIGDYTMQHVDFDVKSRDYRPFKVHDYCWQEQGYALLSRYHPDLAPLLDQEFRHIFNLTYNTFSGTSDVDTSPFRNAIWYYVHRIKGLLHDDFNYRDVNTYLNIQLKVFVKKVACAPETIRKKDLAQIGGYLPEEKVHIALLAAESRRQAELLYGLHALTKFLTG